MADQTPTRDTDRQFTIVRRFAAPRQRVWQAWTDPTVAVTWWHPARFTTSDVEIDLRPDGEYRYTMHSPEGGSYPTTGVYTEVREPEHLQFTWGDPGDDPADCPLITVDLAEIDDETTEMTFHLVGIDGEPGDDDVYEGWDTSFAELDRELAR